MNTKMFSENDVVFPRAYQNNQHAHAQEKHWAYIAAEWRADHQEPAERQPDRARGLFSRLLAFLTTSTGQFAIDSRQ